MDRTDDRDTDLIGSPGSDGQRVPVNVYETEHALVVVAPMPGIMPDDVQVCIRDNALVLVADVRSDATNRKYLAREWDYGGYYREFPLPEGFGLPITATLGNGQLAVTLSRGGVVGDGPLTVQPD